MNLCGGGRPTTAADPDLGQEWQRPNAGNDRALWLCKGPESWPHGTGRRQGQTRIREATAPVSRSDGGYCSVGSQSPDLAGSPLEAHTNLSQLRRIRVPTLDRLRRSIDRSLNRIGPLEAAILISACL